MEKHDEELIRSLIDRDAELRAHYLEHEDFKQQIARLNAKPHLTAEEEVERKRLQKLKLAGKDRMMEILHRYRSAESPQH
jgi:uncharacterized protein YdcH (DUF465 family)